VWEDYLRQVVREEVVSSTCGFPKALDFHFSFDCVDKACVIDDVAARLDELGQPYRWISSPQQGGQLWWMLYTADPTGYGIETHYVRWRDPPDPAAIAPGCFGTFPNGTCPGAVPGQCT